MDPGIIEKVWAISPQARTVKSSRTEPMECSVIHNTQTGLQWREWNEGMGMGICWCEDQTRVQGSHRILTAHPRSGEKSSRNKVRTVNLS